MDPVGTGNFDSADSYVFDATVTLTPDAQAGTPRTKMVLGKGTDGTELCVSLFTSYGVVLEYQNTYIATNYTTPLQYNI